MSQNINPFDLIEEEDKQEEVVTSTPIVDSAPLALNPFDLAVTDEEESSNTEVTVTASPDTVNPFDLIEEGQEINEEGEIVTEEPTIARKVAYGAAQEPMILGSISRLAEAGYETLFEDKEWEEARADVEAERQEEILEEFPEFRGGKYDTDAEVIGGRVATAIADPVTYLVPWVKAAKAGKLVLGTTGAATASGEYALHSYALTGEVDPNMLAIVSGAGGTLAVAGDTFVRMLSKKYSKGPTEEQILEKVESRIIRGTDDIGKLNTKEQELLNESFKLPSVKSFYSQMQNIDNNTDLLRGLKELKKDIRLGNISAKEARPLELRIKSKLDKKFLEMTDMRTKAQIDIAELLYKNKSFSAKAFEVAIRPMFGTLMMGGAGIALDADDSQLYGLMAIGFGSGALSRKLKNNTFLPQEVKKEVMNSVFKRQVAFTLRNIDINFSATLATKLKALGPETGYFSDLMFHQFKARGARQLSVEERATMAYNHWMMTLYDDVLKTTSKDTQQSAVKILRGYAKDSDMTDEAVALSNRFKDFFSDYKAYHADVDIHPLKEWDNYFPREYDFDLITKDGKAFKDVLAFVYKKQNPKKPKTAVEKFTREFIQNFYTNSNRPVAEITQTGKMTLDTLPFIKHIEKERKLHGVVDIDGVPTQVEELLAPWLKNDPAEILSNMIKESTKTVEFARTWGSKGELLSRLRKQIHDKYAGTIEDKRLYAEHNREIKYMKDAINAYFGRYGISNARGQTAAGTIAMYNNLSMLEDVSLANLGDLIQPFQNSTFFKSALEGLKKTSATKTKTALDNKEPARYLAMKQTQELQNEIQELSGLTNDASNIIRKTNQGFFKVIGLQNVTSYARRFAYNSGALDAYSTAVEWVKLNNKNIKAIENKTGKKWGEFTHEEHVKLLSESKLTKKTEHLRKRLSYSGISTAEAKRLAQFKSFDDAFNGDMKYALNTAGFRAMERDSKIPTVGNRLLYTQTKNPWIKLVGQFSSWAQAKTAQVNSLVSRIEDGETRLAMKMATLLSIYGGVKELREIIADGELSRESKSWGEFLADANQLSGNTGFFGNLASQQYINKYGKDPLNFFPAASTISNVSDAVRSFDITDPEFTPEMRKMLPIPKTLNALERTFGREVFEESSIFKERTYEEEQGFRRGGLVSQTKRLGFNKGGEVSQDATSISEESQILLDNSNVPFVDRVLNPHNYPLPEENEDGSISTHKLSAEIDEEGNTYVFPTKMYTNKAPYRRKYVQYEDSYKALDRAKAEGNVIKFDTIDEAVEFTKNYKPQNFLSYYSNHEDYIYPEKEDKGFLDSISEDYSKRLKFADESRRDREAGEITLATSTLHTAGALAGLGWDTAANVVDTSVTTYLDTLKKTNPKGYKRLASDINQAKDWLVNSDAGQYALNKMAEGYEAYSDWKKDNKQWAKSLESVLNVVTLGLAGKSIDSQMRQLTKKDEDLPLEGEVLPPISTYQYKPNSDTPHLDVRTTERFQYLGDATTDKITKVNKLFNPDVLNKALTVSEGNTKVVYMPPGNFLVLAKTHTSGVEAKKLDRVNKAIDEGVQLEDIPTLTIKAGKGVDSKVIEHDGRHRVNALEGLGMELIPVRVITEGVKEGTRLQTVTNEDGLEVYSFPNDAVYSGRHFGDADTLKKGDEIFKNIVVNDMGKSILIGSKTKNDKGLPEAFIELDKTGEWNTWIINDVEVAPKYRNQKVGKRIYLRAIEEALQNKVDYIDSDALISSDAIRVWEGLKQTSPKELDRLGFGHLKGMFRVYGSTEGHKKRKETKGGSAYEQVDDDAMFQIDLHSKKYHDKKPKGVLPAKKTQDPTLTIKLDDKVKYKKPAPLPSVWQDKIEKRINYMFPKYTEGKHKGKYMPSDGRVDDWAEFQKQQWHLEQNARVQMSEEVTKRMKEAAIHEKNMKEGNFRRGGLVTQMKALALND